MSDPNNLWEKVINTTENALEKGALHPIPTQFELMEIDGIKFIVRILDNLQKKDRAKKEQKRKQKKAGGNFNPFFPYERDLFVADLSDTHVCILNKFNVVDRHLLLITREFESQENLLTLADFVAMWQVLREINGLGFYNAGELAGASQPHKHLQLVPYPLAPAVSAVPIENTILSARASTTISTSPRLPFLHAIAFWDSLRDAPPLEAAQITLDYYYQLLAKVGLNAMGQGCPPAYNLLITREWMLLVPRSQAEFKSISINSLGFAGAFLVKNERQRQTLLEHKPLYLLQQVARRAEQV